MKIIFRFLLFLWSFGTTSATLDLFSSVSSYSLQQSKRYNVPNVNESSRGLTVSLLLEPFVVKPTVGNVTVEVEAVVRFSLDRKPLFHIEAEHPWRKLRVSVYLSRNPISCRIDDRLLTNRNYTLTTQLMHDDGHLVVFIFLDGILRSRCIESVESNPFERNNDLGNMFGLLADSNSLSVSVEDTPRNNFLRTHELLYWAEVLPYRDVQFLSATQIVLGTKEGESTANAGLKRSEHTWYQKTRRGLSISTESDQQECTVQPDGEGSCESPAPSTPPEASLSSNVALLLWPHFYSQRINSSYPSWFAAHLVDAVENAVWAIETYVRNSTSRVEVCIPLTASHKERALESLTQLQDQYIAAGLSVTLFVHDMSALPYAGRGDTGLYSYGQVANSAVQEMLSGQATAVKATPSLSPSAVSHVALLSSHIYPEDGWLQHLLDASGEGAVESVVGGKILAASGELMHFGFEMFELPYAGGTEVLLTPHHRYR